jgi:hypothetical protein
MADQHGHGDGRIGVGFSTAAGWTLAPFMSEAPPTLAPVHPLPLLAYASAALNAATAVLPADRSPRVEERNVWQPGSWLIQRCWQMLADAGAVEDALAVARLTALRHPLAPLQALHRVAKQSAQQPALVSLVQRELAGAPHTLLQVEHDRELALRSEQLLLVAATAARVSDLPLACACLEQLDQMERPWERVMMRMEARTLLAESLAYIGAHPLVDALIDSAIRRFDDNGAYLVHDTATLIAELGEGAPPRCRRLFQRCIDAFRYASLTTLLARRLAAATLGRGGLVDDVLGQLALIANVQDARRETGLSTRSDETVIRQVKRPSAKMEVDFQVYTLQQAIAAMPIRRLPRETRILLADQLASLSVRSDGWTAAGAATTLIDLGALKYAIEVVEHIAANDPTRAEGMLSLVRGLLAVGETAIATREAERALAWARARPDRNPERAIIWGLAAIFLEQEQPHQALRWLAQWREPSGWRHRLGALWRKQLDDDDLRLTALRFRALVQQQRDSKEIAALFAELREWGPRLLEGEALVNFLLDNLLRPLVMAGRPAHAWSLLPDLVKALSAISGNKYSVQVEAVAGLLAQQVRLAHLGAAAGSSIHNGASASTASVGGVPDQTLWTLCEDFLADLWKAAGRRGAWQAVHSLEGSLPLVLALEGPATIVALARAASDRPGLWGQ